MDKFDRTGKLQGLFFGNTGKPGRDKGQISPQAFAARKHCMIESLIETICPNDSANRQRVDQRVFQPCSMRANKLSEKLRPYIFVCQVFYPLSPIGFLNRAAKIEFLVSVISYR